MISLTALVTPITAEEATETILSTCESLGLPARSWPVGGVARVIIVAVATLYAGFTVLLADVVSAGFLDLASRSALTSLAYYLFGVSRVTATFATGQITLVNAGGAVFVKAARTVRFVNPTTRKAFVNSGPFTLGAFATLVVDIVAVEVGSASGSAPGTITTIETTMLLVTASNVAAVGGNDNELDPVLRQRCRDRLGALSVAGPRSAYSYWARTATRIDGSTVDVNRVTVSSSSHTGVVTVWIASPSGTPTASDVTDVIAAIEANVRPDTVTSNVVGASTVALSLAGVTIWARSEAGASAATISAAASAALTTLAKGYPISGLKKPPSLQGYLFGDAVSAAIMGSHAAIFDVDGADTDLALGAGEVPVLTAPATVNLVSGVA